MERGRGVDRRGHRRRQGAGQRAAARVGAAAKGRGGQRRSHAGRAPTRPSTDAFVPRLALPVYARQRFPDPVLGERVRPAARRSSRPTRCGCGIWATTSASCRSRPSSTRSAKRCSTACSARSTRPSAVRRARALADEGAVLARRQSRRRSRPAVQAGQWDGIEAMVAKFQQTSLRLRYSLVPTVAAVRGMALGGSCEFILHCDRDGRGAGVVHRPGRGGRRPPAGGRRLQGVRACARPRR